MSDFLTHENQEVYTLGKMSLKSCQLFGKFQWHQPFMTVLNKPKTTTKKFVLFVLKIFSTPENSENVTKSVYVISD